MHEIKDAMNVKARIALLAIAVTLLFQTASSAAVPHPSFDPAPYVRPARLVDVDGHKLNIYCTGHGSPTVILDAGEGDTMSTWRKVQAGIAKFTRVCSYDRAGMGFSQGGPLPRDAAAIVTDLHGLLSNAGIAPPYILVGHSIAGMYALLYADRYFHDVAGMVLVDPSFPNQTQALEKASPTMKRFDKAAPAAYRLCYEAALHRDLTTGSDKYAICGFPAHAAALVKAQCAKSGVAVCALLHAEVAEFRRPAFWLDLGSEDAASGARDSAEVLQAQRRYGDMPLIVLTAANDVGPPPPFPAAEMRAVERVWTAGNDRMARLSSVGVNFVVRHCEHYIQLDRPAVVISAVYEVMSQAPH